MKKINANLLALLVLTTTLSVMNGCKKGAEDPFLSLRSRDSRIEGSWNLSSYTLTTETTEVETDASYNTTETTVTTTAVEFDGEEWITKTESSTVSSSSGYSYESSTSTEDRSDVSWEMTIEKDGTFAYENTETPTFYSYTSVSGGYTYSDSYAIIDEDYATGYTGNWNWVDDGKNKSGVEFWSPSNGLLFYGELTRLSNKDMKISGSEETSSSGEEGSESTSYTSTTTFEYNFTSVE
jgi:hypothetical protein